MILCGPGYSATSDLLPVDTSDPLYMLGREHFLSETNADAVEAAKQQVLNDYNFFELIVKHISDMNPNASKKQIMIKEDLCFFDFKKWVIIFKRWLGKISYKFAR